MRSIDDQMNEIRRRKEIYGEAKNLRKKMIGETIVSLVCLGLMISTLAVLPKLDLVRKNTPILQYGSLIQSASVIGYILISILAFAAGVAATMACVHWRDHKKKEQEI